MILCPIDRGDYVCVLESITKEQEDNIENKGIFVFENNGYKKDIPIEQIYFYGDIDLNNEEDIKIIKSKNLVDVECKTSMIPVDFDYNTGYGKIEHNIPKIYPTIDSVKWFKYVHCRLGKPKYVIAYKINKKLLHI